MKFKEFEDWCNARACDGCWGISAIVICTNIMRDVREQPFWKRQRYWQEQYEKEVLEKIVNPLNEKRKEILQGEVAENE